MNYTILRDRWLNSPVESATVSLDNGQVEVRSSSKLLLSLIENILPYPSMRKLRIDGAVYKANARSNDENLLGTLKQNLYYPYRLNLLDEKFDKIDKFKYNKIYSMGIIHGESRHERPSTSVK